MAKDCPGKRVEFKGAFADGNHELLAVEYPAPGDAQLAGEITELVKPTWVGHDRDNWGIDQGAWSVLAHAFPSADIPVVQLSVNAL